MAVNDSSTEQLFAADLILGQSYSGEPRIIRDEEFQLFARLTGDAHPIHYDDVYASKTRFGRRLAHGLLVTSMTALGAAPVSRRLEESMVAFVGHDFSFQKPVFIGDSLTSRFTVESVERKSEGNVAVVRFAVQLHNQHAETVVEGHHSYLFQWEPS